MMSCLRATFVAVWQDCWFFRLNVVFAIVGLLRAFVF